MDVTELFHTYEIDFNKSIGEAEDVIRQINGLNVVNPNNKTVSSFI